MATAPGPLRTTVGNLCLGSAPDSWGVWFPEDEHQVSYTRFLDELVQAGYEWLELGPYGCLPTDPQRLKAELDARGLKRGVCVSPPAGVPRPADVVGELAELDAELFVIVEQDLYPCAPQVPLPIAVSTREHLAGCGLSGTRRPAIDR